MAAKKTEVVSARELREALNSIIHWYETQQAAVADSRNDIHVQATKNLRECIAAAKLVLQ